MNKFSPLSLVTGRCEHLFQWTIAVICHTPWTIGHNSTVYLITTCESWKHPTSLVSAHVKLKFDTNVYGSGQKISIICKNRIFFSPLGLTPPPTLGHRTTSQAPLGCYRMENVDLVDVRSCMVDMNMNLASSLQGAQKKLMVSRLLHGAKDNGEGRWTSFPADLLYQIEWNVSVYIRSSKV